MIRQWMKDWLRYVHWYWKKAMSPDVILDQFMDAPVVTTHYHVNRKSELLKRRVVEVVRFGCFPGLGLSDTYS